MRLVFCGTPDFAVPALAALLDAGSEIPLVVSQPDRVRGRRGAPEPTPVRRLALERGLPTAVLEKGGRAALYEQVLALDPDVVVVVAFGHIIREPLLTGPRLGCVNVHASLLPRWRGPAPIHTAIVAGDTETGVCTMQLAPGVDTGDVYACERTTIGPSETAGQLHDRLADLGGTLLVRTLEGIEAGSLRAHPQDGGAITHAPMLERNEGSVDFGQPARRIHDRVRGLHPWPGTTVDWQGRRLKIFDSEVVDIAPSATPGTVLDAAEGLLVATTDGAVRLRTLQAEGTRAMPAEEFARGHGLRAGQKLAPLPGFSPRSPRW